MTRLFARRKTRLMVACLAGLAAMIGLMAIMGMPWKWQAFVLAISFGSWVLAWMIVEAIRWVERGEP